MIRAVEVFCCSGGMALGFRRAGVDFELAVDFDRDACDSYERNLGHRPIQIDARDLLRVAGLTRDGSSAIDLAVFDPPCTPWSRAGKRQGLSDDRDMLRTTVELIEAWRPTCWLVGNVPGLDDSTNADAVQQTIGRLGAHYCVDFASLDAAAYGVPQHRVRPFWFGHPRGEECISWPRPTHGPVDRQLQIPGADLRPYVTTRDALSHLKPRQLGRPIKLRWKTNCHPPSEMDKPGNVVACSQAGNGGAVLIDRRLKTNHRVSTADEPGKTLTKNAHGDGALLTNSRHPINRGDIPSRTVTSRNRGAQGAGVLEWPWNRPSTTVTCRDEVSQANRNGRRGASQSANAIKLSELAGAILQGFPPDWKFCGSTKKARWGQLGMAMPPPLAYAVAAAIVARFEVLARERAA